MPPRRDITPNRTYIELFDELERIQNLLVHVLTLTGYERDEGVYNRLQPIAWLNDYFEDKGLIRWRASGLQDQCLKQAYQALLGEKRPSFSKLMGLYDSGELIQLPVYCEDHLFCLSFFQINHRLYMGITNGGHWPSAAKERLPNYGIQINKKKPQIIYQLTGDLNREALEGFYFAGTGRQDINSIVDHLETFLSQHQVIDSWEVPTTIKQKIGNCGWYNFTCAARLPLYVQEYRRTSPDTSAFILRDLGSFSKKVNQLYRDWLREVQVYMLIRSHNICVLQNWTRDNFVQTFLLQCRDKISHDVNMYAHRAHEGYRQGEYQAFLNSYDPTKGCIIAMPSIQTVDEHATVQAILPPPPAPGALAHRPMAPQAPIAFFPPAPPAPSAPADHQPTAPLASDPSAPLIPRVTKNRCCVML